MGSIITAGNRREREIQARIAIHARIAVARKGFSRRKNYLKLKKVSINDALPVKAARRDAVANLKFLGASNLSCRPTQCRFI